MTSKTFYIIAGVILFFAAGWGTYWYTYLNKQPSSVELDKFAMCLRDKQVTMYGAAWCPHCQSEKKAFGKSFRFVPYVECPQEIKRCLDLGIEGYPTWIFPGNRKLVGEQGLDGLARESGCSLGNYKL